MAIKTAAINQWIPSATNTTEQVVIPRVAFTGTLRGSGTITNDIRSVMLGVLDACFRSQEAGAIPIAGQTVGDVPQGFAVSRVLGPDQIQYIVTIGIAPSVTLPAWS